MRRDRLVICLLAIAGGLFCIQFGPTAAIIGGAFAVWIIACALIPAPPDETTKENYADHQTRTGL